MAYLLKSETGNSFTAATWQALLPGYLVKAMSVAAPSTDIMEDFTNVDKCDAVLDNELCVGISLGSFISGDKAAIATTGTYRVFAGGAIVAGAPVSAETTDPLSVLAWSKSAATTGSKVIGQALGAAASGEEVFIKLTI